MTRAELEHAIRAAGEVAEDEELFVFGSQSVLGQHPNAPPGLRHSGEADIMPKNHPERIDAIDYNLGENSRFHDTFGFYVHGVSIEAATLPDGWVKRCVAVRNVNTNGKTGWCLEPHDLAVSKLAASRERDRPFVRIMLRDGLIRPKTLSRRLGATELDPVVRGLIKDWLKATCAELGI